MVYELLYTDGRVRSTIEFRSADRPESLRGDGVHGAVADEAGYWKRDAYISLLTTLTRTRGKLRVISTPKGRSWFWEEWCKGWFPDQRKKNPEYWSYQLPTSVNPFVRPEEIETLRRNMPDKVFRQEILAEFLEDGSGVFSNIRACQKSRLMDGPINGRRYILGIDWAKDEDYTVFVVMDADLRKVCHIARHQGLDWNVNMDKAIRLAKTWNKASIIMDSTGVGSVPFDTISSTYALCEGYNIYNNEPKVALIQRLQLALERTEVYLPIVDGYTSAEDPTGYKAEMGQILENELMTYSSNVSATGKFQYSAPEGFHDDAVIALALATWKASEAPLVYRYDSIRGL